MSTSISGNKGGRQRARTVYRVLADPDVASGAEEFFERFYRTAGEAFLVARALENSGRPGVEVGRSGGDLYVRAVSVLDQAFAKARAEALAKLEKESPAVAALYRATERLQEGGP